ncbi:MAG: hypothetical protein JJ869_09480 [Marivita sp.]|uniref:hypothetical protein n=1 Tax=Marivita sp. TaxID=2003365 RepID=UPI001B21FDD2|nr:hypothetical protein [Marivita sp.]MBO6883795.1 hypothetical protein [Marivita sp.]
MTAFSGFCFRRNLVALCFGYSLFAASIAAAKEDGLITLTLADQTLELPLSAGHSDWTGTQGFIRVSIFSRPSDLETWKRFQSLRLAFDLLRNSAQLPEMSLLRRTGDADFERWYGRGDSGGLTVMVTDSALDGDLLRVTGTFTGTLGQSGDFGRTIDLSAPMPVSGDFSVTLLPIR